MVTDALAVHTLPVTDALSSASLDTAVLAAEVWEAHTLSVYAVALVAAVARALLLAAVVPREALVAHTLPVHASSIVVAFVWAGGHRAVWAFPARVAEAAAGVLLVCAVATAVCGHAWGEKHTRPDSWPNHIK